MDYKETIEFLYAQLPVFSRDGASAFKKDLGNTLALCAALGDPQTKFKSIHIAGTNGKGSCSHMLAAIFQEAGYKAGLYTSPHLYDFRERIRINGALCSEDFVVQFVQRIRPYLDRIQPSFFEITVVMAFCYFEQQKVDIAIIETGLGGRLDSTNVITPELSLITNIGYDHMQFLGNTLTEIAGEKAGIIKEGRPVVISEYLPETKPVFEQVAKNKHAPLFLAQNLWQMSVGVPTISTGNKQEPLLTICVRRKNNDSEITQIHPMALANIYQLDLNGSYQLKNIVGVLEAVHQLRSLGWNIEKEALRKGLKRVKELTGIAGRWDQVSTDPWIITDVGHNVDGIKMIRNQLSKMKYSKLHIITGFVKDKDVSASLKEMPKNAQYYFTQAPIPRALSAVELKALALKFELEGNAYPNMKEALAAARANYHDGDLILICGSVFLVAEVKDSMRQLDIIA